MGCPDGRSLLSILKPVVLLDQHFIDAGFTGDHTIIGVIDAASSSLAYKGLIKQE
jgi:hypothetical protein